jgi:serine/threonine protein kinase/TolA-binding protein
MVEPKQCPHCGAKLSDDGPGGACPACLISLADPEPAQQDALPSGVGASTEVLPEPLTEGPGSRIGRYKLLQQIGEGGCGIVYMAEQEEPIHRRVALKVIKLGMDTKQVIARFDAERQALAMMDHPNIARVFDAGATDAGRPYFAMELVRGLKITDYCDQRNLPTVERLRLFVQVCHAIQHAHQKGIIHRDLKPSNILVTFNDGLAVPKVIDFGIAKATQGRLTNQTLFTAFEQFLGTPAYMSPEQAELTSLDIDTRSDIYSLGVLLYELLTGTIPFDTKALLQAGLDALRRTIREEEPKRPSTRLGTMGQGELTTTAKRRQTDAPKLIALMRGDLDWIVMKCLEKDRARRYDSASALATDIVHHLDDKPISAGAPSRFSRVRKFARRNRGPVLASAAVFATLVAGIVGTTLGLVGQARQRTEAVRQAKEAQRQTEEAKRQTAIAEAVSRFQSDMLLSADPNRLLQAVTAAVKLEVRKSKNDPLVEAGVRRIVGGTLISVGRYAEAEPNLKKAVELCRASLPAGHPSIAENLNTLAGLMLYEARWAEGETYAREALAIFRNSLPPGVSIAGNLNLLGQLLSYQGKCAEAEPLFRESVAMYPKGAPAYFLYNLARAMKEQGKLAEAEATLNTALQNGREALPAEQATFAIGLRLLGEVLQEQGRVAEADQLYREALDRSRKILPSRHPNIADAINDFADLLQSQGKLAEAEPLVQEAFDIGRISLLPTHPTRLYTLQILAMLRRAQGRFAEAERFARESLDGRELTLGADHWRSATARLRLGRIMTEQQCYPDAELALVAAELVLSTNQAAPVVQRDQCAEALFKLYSAWDAAEPGKGYDTKAAEWFGRWTSKASAMTH